MPGMKKGDIMGHETMGEVVEVGSGVNGKLKVGDRVVIPFTITCGECEQCQRGNYSVWLSRRSGRISARAVRRLDPHQGAPRYPGR
jgi:threonine dehydrogenase-like Zn-dependent dehydrogenase